MALIKIKSSTWIKINCVLTVFVTVLLLINYFKKDNIFAEPKAKGRKCVQMNPCCGFPCQNGGVCTPEQRGYTCDCTDTGHYGKHCHKVSVVQWVKNYVKFNPTSKSSVSFIYTVFCKILNHFSLFQTIFNKRLYRTTINWGKANFRWTTNYDFSVVNPYLNITFAERSLPPIPTCCPAEMGIRGPKHLPPTKLVYEKLFKRINFNPCPKGTNLLFATYIQHFTSQFDHFQKADTEQPEWNTNFIDMSHIYGKHEPTISSLRSFQHGKLKSRFHEDQEYPPYLKDCADVHMIYPDESHRTSYMTKMMQKNVITPKWALGNPRLSMSPMLFAMSTIWLREHNRICTLLAKEHRNWTDEQIYQTTKLIITGVAIKITLTDYMKHLMQFKIDILHNPKLTYTLDLRYNGVVAKEFSILPNWQVLMPDHLTIASTTYNMSDILFTNNAVAFEHGFDKLVHAMATEPAGEIRRNNVGKSFQCCIKHTLKESRALKVQSYNNYRRRFGLKPAETFEEITGNLHTATTLKELYLDVEAVELIVGLLMEQSGSGVAPPTMTTLGGAWLIRGLLSHPINSPERWKPITFGGELGMNIVKSASLKKLVCLNMKNKCKDVYVDFKIPKKRLMNV